MVVPEPARFPLPETWDLLGRFPRPSRSQRVWQVFGRRQGGEAALCWRALQAPVVPWARLNSPAQRPHGPVKVDLDSTSLGFSEGAHVR